MKLYFAPDQDCLTPLLAVINGAAKSITVADYSFNCPEVTSALIAKHRAGVQVKILLDKSQSYGKTEIPQILRLKLARMDVTIGESDKHRIMHLKVLVADNTVVFGSYNFTTAAALENNVLAVYTSATDAKTFVSQIQKAIDFIRSSKLTIERNTVNYRDIIVRAAKTFGQAVLAFVVANLASILSIHSLSTGKQLAFATLVAGVSAVWNLVLVPVFKPVTAKLGL